MAPGHQIDEVTVLRMKLAEVESDLDYLKRRQVSGRSASESFWTLRQ